MKIENKPNKFEWLSHPRAFSFILLLLILIWKLFLRDLYYNYF